MNVSFSISKVLKDSHKKEEWKLKIRDNIIINVSFSISKVLKGSHKKEEWKLKRRDNNECILNYSTVLQGLRIPNVGVHQFQK